MARPDDDRLLVICGELAVLAAALLVLTAQLPTSGSTLSSVLGAARFVGAVAAAIFGFIVWFERRYPLDDATPATRRVEV